MTTMLGAFGFSSITCAALDTDKVQNIYDLVIDGINDSVRSRNIAFTDEESLQLSSALIVAEAVAYVGKHADRSYTYDVADETLIVWPLGYSKPNVS